MLSSQDPQEIINPKPKVNSITCPSTHGLSGFLQGTTYDKLLGRFVCPCGRQYTSKIERPNWIHESGISPLPAERQPEKPEI